MTKNKLQKLSSLGVASVLLGSVLAPVVASATPSGSTDSDFSNVAATVNSVISVDTLGNVGFSITPKAGGAISSAKDVVTVSTNSSTGYTLAIVADQTLTNTNEDGNGETFSAASGSILSPSTLGLGKWGFAAPTSDADVSGNFDSEYNALNSVGVTLQQTGYDSTWAAVPVEVEEAGTLEDPEVSQALPFKDTDGIADGDHTDVWFAANAGMLQATGIYTAVVTYTATTNIEA